MTRQGWTRLRQGIGRDIHSRCGGEWKHDSGWHIEHCGHPTANWPYFLWHESRNDLNVMSHNGRGFTRIDAAQRIVEEIAAGELPITTGNCARGIARTPTRTAAGEAVPLRPDAMHGWMQGTWTEQGLLPSIPQRGSITEEDETMNDERNAPPISGEADLEYQARIDAARCTEEWKHKRGAQTPQESVEDLPLFGGDRQGGLFG